MKNEMTRCKGEFEQAQFRHDVSGVTSMIVALPLRAWIKKTPTLVVCTIAVLIISCVSGCGASTKETSAIVPPASNWKINPADLRFQGVSTLPATTLYEFTFELGDYGSISWPRYYGTPFELGGGLCGSTVGNPRDCAWGYNVNSVQATGFAETQKYSSDVLTNFVSDPDLADTTSVIHSLDIEVSNKVFATASTSTLTSSGFHSKLDHVQLTDIAATVSAAGKAGRVVTALSLDSPSSAYVLSYSWDQDRSSVYDEVVKSITYETLQSTAQLLGSQGYVITAFGGNQSNGYYLVGTRLLNSDTPRNIVVPEESDGATPPASLFSEGYAVVAILNSQDDKNTIWVMEK